MDSNKLLTISVAAYNVSAFLEQTLDSLIVKRNRDRLEVLIVNDGSKDGTASIAKKYVEKYPDMFILIDKENGGHGSTINEGIKRATGKYLKVLDGDDWVNTGALEELLDRLEVTDADLVLTDRVDVYPYRTQPVRFGNTLPENEKLYFKDIRKPVSITLSSISVKTRLLKESGYCCLENCFYEDLEFDCYAISVSKDYIYYPIDLYQYRLGLEGQSVSIASRQKNIHMSCRVAKTIDAFYCAKEKELSEGQKLCIVERATMIHTQAISTYMTFKPDSGKEKELRDFISEIQSVEIRKSVKKNKLYMYIICVFPFTYRLLSTFYRHGKQSNG